jgi:hypothetical protein
MYRYGTYIAGVARLQKCIYLVFELMLLFLSAIDLKQYSECSGMHRPITKQANERWMSVGGKSEHSFDCIEVWRV